MERARFAIGVTAFLLAFKAAVDGYVPIDAIIENESGSRYMALQYYIEKQRLIVWGRYFNVNDQARCTFQNESPRTQQLIAAILAEIWATHSTTLSYLSWYNTTIPRVENSDSQSTRSSLSGWVKRNFRKQRHPTRKGVKDKGKFEGLINKISKLNTDLYSVMKVRDSQLLDKALVPAVVASLDDIALLDTLHEMGSRHPEGESLLSLSAKVKKLQSTSESDAAKSAIRIPDSSIALGPAPGNNRSTQSGYYNSSDGSTISVWIEWKSLPPQPSIIDKELLERRILGLGAFLSIVAGNHSQFSIPQCLGTFEDRKYTAKFPGQNRIGYVYRVPEEAGNGLLRYHSLHDIITRSAQAHDRYPLGTRFQLAKTLAVSMSLLHACKWLHKGFCSQNIIFASPTSETSISHPMITGFEYSDPTDSYSMSMRPIPAFEVSIYQHPAIGPEFQKIHDVYSLGVVLFEIALWRPLVEIRAKRMRKGATQEAVREFLLNNLSSLRGLVGNIYTDVVQACLTGAFIQTEVSDNAVFEKAFFCEVVQKLDSCRA